MTTPRSVSSTQIDNNVVHVSESRFAPGATTGWHRHAHDYVVIPITTGKLLVTTASGESVAHLATGQAYFRPAGTEHDVKNINDHEFVFVEVEIRR